MIHAYKEINEVVGLNGWIVISCCFNHDVHPCEDVFPMSSPWIIVYININLEKERDCMLYVCVCVCDCMCILVIYIYINTYAHHQKPYIRTYKNVHQHESTWLSRTKPNDSRTKHSTQTPPESVLGSCNHCWPSDTTSCLRLVPLKIGAFEALYDVAKAPKR